VLTESVARSIPSMRGTAQRSWRSIRSTHRITPRYSSGWIRAARCRAPEWTETPAVIFIVIQKEAEHYSKPVMTMPTAHMHRITLFAASRSTAILPDIRRPSWLASNPRNAFDFAHGPVRRDPAGHCSYRGNQT